jgi:PAS domain S-box-containing protein
VVLLTGNSDDALAEEALTAGVSDYLQKERMDPPILERTLRYAIERERTYRAVEDAAARLRFMFETTPGFAWEADVEGDLRYVSGRWSEFLGVNSEALSLFDRIHPQDESRVISSWSEANLTKSEWRAEYRVLTASGSFRWIASRATIGKDPDGSLRRVGLSVSVDEQKALEQDLQSRVEERTEALSEAHLELESVSYSMSHDMRAPVRAILATSCELLEDIENLPGSVREALNRQCQTARRMHRLVDGMIRYIRLVRSPIQPIKIDLTLLATELAHEFRNRQGSDPATVWIESGLSIFADPDLARLTLQAVLDNAFKFKDSRRPNVITIFGGDNPGDVWVQDHGIGFDARYADKAFLPFERLHRDSEYPGVGIGLALAKRAVNRHGGTMSIQSELGVGTRVGFTFPTSEAQKD